ncbi:hypothetical protein V490_05553 [Pseudogymnoascus sp. VKM F-3557]|nr:hypothetical protein V490_05553 [Pseudogymnoascus sp. VKM F-3557]
MLSFPYAKAQSNVKRSSLDPQDREHPRIDGLVLSGVDSTQLPCEKMLEGIAGGLGIPPCEVKEVKGVCVVRSCPEAGAVPDTVPDAAAHDAEPPTEELAGTPTVDKASSWRPVQGAKDAGAVCTSDPCSSQADEKSVKRQIGSDNKKRPPGAPTGTVELQKNPPASTVSTQPDGTQSAVPGLQTLVEESGEAKGMVRGVVWNSCASSAAMLVLVAIGVVVLL